MARFGPGRDFSLAFANGCFDLLHEGHRALLTCAAAEADRLVVGLNGDDSVRRLKGPGRPVQDLETRAAAVLALPGVDAVTSFAEDTPLALIEALLPDVLVKGADYAPGDVVGREVVERRGGRLVLVPLIPDVSTTRRILTDPARGSHPRGPRVRESDTREPHRDSSS